MNTVQQLHKYQLRAINFILDKKKCALYLGMGLGKTIISLTSLIKIKQLKNNTPLRALIIGPLKVVNNVWHNELQAWEHTKDLTYSIITGSAQRRAEAISEVADIYLINRENIMWLYENNHTSWDVIIIDESSSFKNAASKRFKALRKFKYEYMVQLSGTPSPNGLLDLWSQIYLLDHGERLGKNIYMYKYFYFNSDYFGYKFTPKDPELIYNKISDITLSLKSEDYLELPPKIELVTKVEIDSYKEYKKLERDFILSLKEKDIIALNAGALSNKLLQFCNGAVYDEQKNIVEVHNSKLEALNSIIEEHPTEPILVAYNYQSDLKRIVKHFKEAEVMDKAGNNMVRWNKGEIKLFLCHPASCGKGLNLQAGGRIIVWFGLTWNLEDYLQFNARLHRQGQVRPVVINHIVADGCIDEVVIKLLQEKNMSQDSLLQALT